jgi:hypothetical protein
MFFQHHKQTFCFGRDRHGAERDTLLCVVFNPVIRSFYISDIGPSEITVCLVAFNEPDPVTADWRAITITFNFVSRLIILHGFLLATLGVDLFGLEAMMN